MTTQPESAGGRPRAGGRSSARSAKLSRDVIVHAALTFLDREGWDALTINALATQLGTKGPSLYNHVDSLEDLRRTVRMHVIDDILQMLSTVGQGRTRDDAVMAMASAYRSYAHHHPGRYSAFTRMPLEGDDPGFTAAAHAAAAPVIEVLASYGLDGRGRLLRVAGVLGGAARLRAAGDDRRHGRGGHRRGVLRHGAAAGGRDGAPQRGHRLTPGQPGRGTGADIDALTCGKAPYTEFGGACRAWYRGGSCLADRGASGDACAHAGQIRMSSMHRIRLVRSACDTPGRGVRGRTKTAVQRLEERRKTNER